jgi:hypothetical protein
MLTMPLILQTPSAMLGLLTLLIPLGIHLLSKARPRVITFAHIAFIKVKSSPLLRQFRLTQLILLGLRMLLLLIATLILAQLYWHNVRGDINQQVKSHILLTEDWLHHATDIEKQTLFDQTNDSSLVLLSTQNRIINKSEIIQLSTNSQQTPALNLWSKVADYTAQLSADEAISVYTTNRLKQFLGGKLALTKQVEWQVKTIHVKRVEQQYSANIKVIYDDASESLLVYLRAAFEVINTHEKLSLKVDYLSSKKLKKDSVHLLDYDKIINLSKQNITSQNLAFDAQWQHTYITQAERNNIKQADFVLTLARLLYSSQSQAWWLENTRLSTAQITQPFIQPFIQPFTQPSTVSDDQKTLSFDKNTPNKTSHSTSLHIWLALMLVTIFIVERLLSEWPYRKLKTGLGK